MSLRDAGDKAGLGIIDVRRRRGVASEKISQQRCGLEDMSACCTAISEKSGVEAQLGTPAERLMAPVCWWLIGSDRASEVSTGSDGMASTAGEKRRRRCDEKRRRQRSSGAAARELIGLCKLEARYRRRQ